MRWKLGAARSVAWPTDACKSLTWAPCVQLCTVREQAGGAAPPAQGGGGPGRR